MAVKQSLHLLKLMPAKAGIPLQVFGKRRNLLPSQLLKDFSNGDFKEYWSTVGTDLG